MLKGATKKVNESLKKYSPLQIIAMTYGTLAIPLLYNMYRRMTLRQKKLLMNRFFMGILNVPVIGSLLQRQIDKKLNPAKKEIDESLHKDRNFGFEPFPYDGIAEEALLTQAKIDCDATAWGDQMSGAQYLLQSLNLPKFAGQIFEIAAYTNPMHTSAFGRIKQRENQVIAWCDELFHGKGDIRGNITPGGTYSIFEAMGAYSNWAEKRGIGKPNVVAPRSVHPAFRKACKRFKLDLIEVPIDLDTGKADIYAMSKAIDSNTICLVGSVSNFPTGSIDNIEKLSKLAVKRKIGLHVDMCLGGGVAPFAEEAGVKLPPFDFSLPGVSSISVDAHKYLLAPKETSIILFSPWAFKNQGLVELDSAAGTYVTVNMAGSRSGAMILLVNLIMARVGKEGYVKITKDLFALKDKIVAGITSIEGLRIYGSPDLTTVAFAFDDNHSHLNIHCVTGLMNEKKWYFIDIPKTKGLSDRPFSHFTLTAFHLQNNDFVNRFINDLAVCTKHVKDNPKELIGSNAKTYASIGKIPDVADFVREEVGLYYIYSNSSLRPVYKEPAPAEKNYLEGAIDAIANGIQHLRIK